LRDYQLYEAEIEMSFPKKGKFFPFGIGGDGHVIDELSYPMVISLALKRSIGDSHSAVKTAAKWTGANERTVKNWFKGKYGPSGEHLMSLANHCDEVMEAMMLLAGRRSLSVSVKLQDLETRLELALHIIRSVANEETQRERLTKRNKPPTVASL
jgi:hypothetical protein